MSSIHIPSIPQYPVVDRDGYVTVAESTWRQQLLQSRSGWTAYTPIVTNVTGITLQSGFYVQSGKHTSFRVAITGTGNGSRPTFTLPFIPKDALTTFAGVNFSTGPSGVTDPLATWISAQSTGTVTCALARMPWTSWTPTITNSGTTSNLVFLYQQVRTTTLFRMSYNGTGNGSAPSFTLPFASLDQTVAFQGVYQVGAVAKTMNGVLLGDLVTVSMQLFDGTFPANAVAFGILFEGFYQAGTIDGSAPVTGQALQMEISGVYEAA